MRGFELLNKIRKDLADLNEKILDHPYIREAESGRLNQEKIVSFVINQIYIVYHDMRSLALMLSKAKYGDEVNFFKTVLDGDLKAYDELHKLCDELKIDCQLYSRINPIAVCYTHYLSWLALYANPGESALALIVNLPIWGENNKKLLDAFSEMYHLKNLGFFKLFTQDYRPLEMLAYPIIENYYDMSRNRYDMIARMIQAYEKAFWDAIYL